MGKRKAIKTSANKKSRIAQTASTGTLSGGAHDRRTLPSGHVRKAKHHRAQEGHHREQSRNLGRHHDTGKVKRRNINDTPAQRAGVRRMVGEHDRAAAAHGAAKRAHIKAAKSRKPIVRAKISTKAPSASQLRKKK